MAVTVRIARAETSIEDYVWTSKEASLAGLLNAMLDPLGPSGADPNPDLTAAQAAIKILGGEILDAGEPLPYEPGMVY